MPAKKKVEDAVKAVEAEVKKTRTAAKSTVKKVADQAVTAEVEAKKRLAKPLAKLRKP